MIPYRNRGFTLIELLIVIAIVSIVMSSSIALFTAPLHERNRAVQDEAFETGAGTLFARFVQDAHSAAALDTSTSGALRLTLAGENRGEVVYSIDTSGTLTRTAGSPPNTAKLINNVTGWQAQPDGAVPGLWTIRLDATLPGYRGERHPITRKVDVLVGKGGRI